MGNVLKEAEHALNTDRILAEHIGRAGNVLLPMLFTLVNPAVGRTRRCPSS